MKRPSIFVYLLGNLLSAVLVLPFGALLVYQWYIGKAPLMIALVSAFCIFIVINARLKLLSYQDWKRKWNAMGEVSGAVPAVSGITPLRMAIGLIAYIVLVGIVASDGTRSPQSQFAIAGMVLAFIPMFVYVLYRFWRYYVPRTDSRQSRLPKKVPVSVCLSVPRQSPSRQQTSQHLPEYCSRLLSLPK
jgi:hypothetical protein